MNFMDDAKIAVAARPITPNTSPCILLEQEGRLVERELLKGEDISLDVKYDTKYCAGWYDIENHVNHPCSAHEVVDLAHDNCFTCRKKTDFNPAFYNTIHISDKQARYNNCPHSVYIAYFGNGIAKAGIMSDSRGMDRIYEQGALLYVIIGSYPNATVAHNLEARLISKGLKNSVTKKQKLLVYESVTDLEEERLRFKSILAELGYDNIEIESNLDMFFFGEYPNQPIRLFGRKHISGKVSGIVGKYLVLENNERYYGFWLSDLFGYKLKIGSDIIPMDREPVQVSLF